MTRLSTFLIVPLLVAVVYGKQYKATCYVEREDHDSIERIVSPPPYKTLSPSDVPSSWDWRDVNGRNYCTGARNQHLPQYCGSCWAFASSASLGDRFRIAYSAPLPEYELAPQVLVDCVTNSSCYGGDPLAAYEHIHLNGIPDETCAPYQAVNQVCTPENICKVCDFDLSDPSKKCSAQQKFPTHYVDEYGAVSGEEAMKAEISTRGPIACVIAVTDALISYSGGIFNDTTGDKSPDHVISIIGYGTDSSSGVNYWTIRNSWGTFWGLKGTFQLIRGTDNLGIESLGCAWATPLVSTN